MESVTSIGPVITSCCTITQEEFDIFELEIKCEVDEMSWEEALFIDFSPEEDEEVICTLCIHEYEEAKGGRRFSARVMETQLWCPHFIVDGDVSRAADKEVPQKNVTKKRKGAQAESSTRQSKRRRGQTKRRRGQTKRRRVSMNEGVPSNMLTVQEPVGIDENIDVVEEELEEEVKNYLAQSSDCTTLTNFLSLVSVSNIH